MKVAALQMLSTPDVDRNLDAARALVALAAEQGAALVALPEYFCLMGHSDRDKLHVAEVDGEGPIQHALAAMARDHGVWLIGGTLPIRTTHPELVRNACCVYGPDGTHVARYDKIHLFRFQGARESYDEGRTLEAGTRPVAFDVPAAADDSRTSPAAPWRLGLTICYDLRFPELFRALMRERPCDLISVPSAFTHTTGQAHWELLLRARAIENQCYILAPAQGGRHVNGRRTFGHSMIIDPWGDVVAVRTEDGEGLVMAELSRERIEGVRAQLPALTHRRL